MSSVSAQPLIDAAQIAANTAAIAAHNADLSIHFSEASIDHANIIGAGVLSHAGIDSHVADASLHYTEASIDHTAIQNIGVNSHAAIDTHLADASVHFTEGSIDHTAIANIGVNGHAAIDAHIVTANAHIADASLHFTEASIDHTAIANIGVNSHAAIDTHLADTSVHFADAPADASSYVRNNNAWVAETVQSFGEYRGIFDASIGTFPVTLNQGDWFNCTTAGTVDGQAFIIGDILVALIDSPSTTVFAANWSIIPHIGTGDHLLLTNIGVNTHAQLDTHLADATLHFTEASIDHVNIANIGVNSHAQIDTALGLAATHRADATIHFTEASIAHANIAGIGVNTHAVIDTHLANAAIHFTEASIDHTAIGNIGVNTHAVIDSHIADTDLHYSDAPADASPYVRQDNAWVSETPGGGMLSSEYRFSTSIVSADPGSGRFRYNNAVHASVTEIYISDINNGGADISNFLGLIATGDRLYIQEEGDSSKFAVWDVVLPAVLDNTGWWTITVSLERDGDVLSNNSRCIIVLQIQGDADFTYLRLDASNSPLTGDLLTEADILPFPLTQQRSVGLDNTRFIAMHSRLGSFVGTSNRSGTIGNNTAIRQFGANPTGIMAGNQVKLDVGVTEHLLGGGAYKSTICAGNVFSYSTGDARLLNTGGGASLFGSAFSYGAGDALLQVQGPAAFMNAYAYTGYGGSAKNHTLLANQSGAVLMGYSYGLGQVDVTCSGYGAFLQGFFSATNASGFAVFRSTGQGSFAQGAIANNAAATSTLESTGAGSFAQGNIIEGTIRASGNGSFAQGRATAAGVLEATAAGAFAHGLAATNDIRAIANGSFAIGDATNGDCIASGVNSCQFGPGTNSLADTFQVGNAGIRFKGTTGAPSALQNGDIWVASGYMYFRTNGVSVKMVACP